MLPPEESTHGSGRRLPALMPPLLTLARLHERWMHARQDDHVLTLVSCRFDSTNLTGRERQAPPAAVAVDDSLR